MTPVMHVVQKRGAVLERRHAQKQRPKAHRMNTFECGALLWRGLFGDPAGKLQNAH
ncbi:hypothetical protein I6F15_25335 [Bradyrhizobium sp. BRP14]|nr:hypothetical protein [Bradyrhizobium sp. BRP14]